ncbi:MAG: rhodanese-like domain-containing protein, partial [Bacteroidota bacterium]
MNKFLIVLILIAFCTTIQSQQMSGYKVAKVSFEDFKQLVQEVESIRAEKLLSLDEFMLLSSKRNTIILDTRSREKYQNKHIEGAINLPFTEFTQKNLEEIIPHKNTKVLIYCNNNFEGDPISFASKSFVP